MANELGETPGDLDNATLMELRKRFEQVLNAPSNRRRVVILIDALNEFERSTYARELTWLPEPLPENTFVVATAIPGVESEAFLRRQATTLKPLPAIDTQTAKRIIRSLCLRHGKPELNPAVEQILLDKQRMDGRVAHANPLWLTLAVEQLDLLGEQDYRHIAAQYSGRAGVRVAKFMQDMVNDYPADVPGMYRYLLDHNVRTYGETLSRVFSSAIALGRVGWRQTDLAAVVSDLDPNGWDELHGATLRRGFGSHVVRKGNPERWDFTHMQLRQAVLDHYLSKPDDRYRIHQVLAEHLKSLPSADPLRQSELMHHLLGADDKAYALLYLSTDADALSMPQALDALAEAIITGARAEPNSAMQWALRLFQTPVQSDYERPLRRQLLWSHYAFDLVRSLERQGATTTLCVTFLRQLVDVSRNATSWKVPDELSSRMIRQIGVATESLTGTALVALGKYLARAGQNDEALATLREAKGFFETLYDQNRTPQQGAYLTHAMESLADLYGRLGRQEAASSLRRRAIELREGVVRDAEQTGTSAACVVARIQALRDSSQVSDALKLYDANAGLLDYALLDSHTELSGEAIIRGCGFLAELLMDAKRPDAAQVFIRRGLGVAERRYLDDPDSTSAHDLSTLYARQVKFHLERNEYDQAVDCARRDLAVVRGMWQRDPSPTNTSYLAGSHVRLGVCLNTARLKENARSHLEESVRLMLKSYQESPSAETARLLANTYLGLATVANGEEDRQQCLSRAGGLIEGLMQNGLSFEPTDLLVLAACLSQEKDGAPREERDKASMLPEIIHQRWAKGFKREDSEDAKRRSFNLPVCELSFVQEPTSDNARRLLEEYVIGSYRYFMASDFSRYEELHEKMKRLVHWAKEHQVDLGEQGDKVAKLLETDGNRGTPENRTPMGVAVSGVWLPDALGKAVLEGKPPDEVQRLLYEEQERMSRATDYPEGLQLCLTNKSELLLSNNRVDEALICLEEAERISRTKRDWDGLERIMMVRARTAEVGDDRVRLDAALATLAGLYKEQGRTAEYLRIHLRRATALLEQGQEEDAMPLLEEGTRLAESSGDSELAAVFRGNQGLVFKARREYDRALEAFLGLTAYSSQTGNKNLWARSLFNAADLMVRKLGTPDRAIPLLQEAGTLAESLHCDELSTSITSLQKKAQELITEKADRERAIHEIREDLRQALDECEPLETRFGQSPSVQIAYELADMYHDLIDTLHGPELTPERKEVKRRLLRVLDWLDGNGIDLGAAREVLRLLRIELTYR